MKRLFGIMLVLSFAFGASAQKLIWKADEILLPGGKIDSLMTDTLFTDATDTDVPSAAAVKAYVANNAGGGNPIDSTTTRNDSIFVHIGGAEYFSGIDKGAVPIGNLSPSQITYVGANGEIVGDSSMYIFGENFFLDPDGASQIYLRGYGNSVNGNEFVTSKARGFKDSPVPVAVGDYLGGIEFHGLDSSGEYSRSSFILPVVTEVGGNFVKSIIKFGLLNDVVTNTNVFPLNVSSNSRVGINTDTPLRALHISGPEQQLRLESTGTGGVDNWLEMVNTSPSVSAANIIQFYRSGNTSAHRTGSIGVPKSIGDSVIVIGLTNDTGNSDDFRFYMRGGHNSYFQAESYGANEVTGTPTTYPAFESNGRMIESTSPIWSFTTATAPSPSNPGDVHYNTDDAEMKISNDGLTYEPLVPKDTIIYTFPILRYNATDTIADQIGFEEYLTTITPDWDRRKVVAFEITTTDTVSTDLYLQLYEENIVAGTSAVPIPVTTNFVLPQGQQSVRFTTADTEIPSAGIEFTLGRAVYAAVTNGSAAGSTSYVATEGANGLYITFYLTQ